MKARLILTSIALVGVIFALGGSFLSTPVANAENKPVDHDKTVQTEDHPADALIAPLSLPAGITGLSTTPDWSVEGDQPAAYLGWSVSQAGDVNGCRRGSRVTCGGGRSWPRIRDHSALCTTAASRSAMSRFPPLRIRNQGQMARSATRSS